MAVEIRKTLLTEGEIQDRVRELAARISRDYAGQGEVLLIGVLRGAFIFLADLCRLLTIPVKIDFIALSSYGMATESSGAVRLLLDVRSNIAGRHVLVVEDIVDSGRTLHYLLGMLSARQPASLKTCAMVRKPGSLQVEVQIDYLGFDIPDVWVVGYGLDCMDEFRNLPSIAAVEVVP
jgi:hypoxanthine phosphoribosyltransferase